ncbi:MAG: diguanylate cyclase domain-containing protein [Spirochaetota bacterium]
MGLLEKALKYKQEINKKGKETLIDTIIGPAATAFINDAKDDASIILQDDESTIDLSNEDLKSIEPIEDELFILPEDSNLAKDKIEADEANYDTTIIQDQEIRLDNEQDFLGPEDEPDLESLQNAYSQEKNVTQDANINNRPDNNQKFRIIESSEENKDSTNTMQESESIKQPLSTEFSIKPDKKFQDFLVLYEIGKEILKSHTLNELYDAILFSIMGQIGSASATLLVKSLDDENALIVADSRGITIKNKNIRFDISKGLFNILMQSKGVVDIEQFKQQTQYRDEYYQLIAIDARLFIPLRYDSKDFGALVLGEKITIGDYSEEEIDFIEHIVEFAAIAYEKVQKMEQLENDVQKSVDDRKFWNELDEYKQNLRKYPQKDYFDVTTHSVMKANGFLSYAVYVKNIKNSNYSLLLTDEDDILLLKDTANSIMSDTAFIDYISALHSASNIEDFDRNRAIREIFSESTIHKMTLYWINPYNVGDDLLGFFCVFRLRDYQRREIQFERFKVLTDVLLSHYLSLQLIESQYVNYIDVTLPVFNRIDKELANVTRLTIPLTIVLFTIKNLKRYHAVQGIEKTQQLMNKIEAIIISRLSDGDFTARIDRNKFLIVLPGKNKKFAVPFANALKNEMVQQFSDKELQLLVTFLMAEYPEDGSDVYSLLDSID